MLHGQDAEVIATDLIEHDHIERRGGRPLFVKPAHMETSCIGASVNELVDGSLIAVKGEHDGLVYGEDLCEGGVIDPVWVDIWRVQGHQINNVHHAHLQFWQVMAQPPGRSHGFHGHDITCTCQHHIGLNAIRIACPLPDGETTRTMFNGLLHGQELQVELFINHNEVHIVAAAQTMIGNGEQTVGIGREIDARDGAF